MATPNRAAILTKAHKVLRKHYDPIKATDRSVLETALYACCLENTPYEKADEAFARLQESYFDWNEVRVTALSELAEVLQGLPDPRAAAAGLKRCLQTMFETQYSFDVEPLRKQNLGKSIKQLEKFGLSPFGIAYVVQAALGGHSIPVDKGSLDALVILGAVSDVEAAKHEVPGLERAIPKNKGAEFGSLLHQLGTDLSTSPFGPKARAILVEIDPDAKDRLPKRSSPKTAPPAAEPSKKKPAGAKPAEPEKGAEPPKKPAKGAGDRGKSPAPPPAAAPAKPPPAVKKDVPKVPPRKKPR